jgi:hypothetical protein
LAADELQFFDLSDGGRNTIYTNGYTDDPVFFWDDAYSHWLLGINSVIEGVEKSKTIPEISKKILLGEAKFLRAMVFFYLVNLYGEVPLVLSTDVKTNSNIPRSSVTDVYWQIQHDLTDAQRDLTDQYLGPDLESATQEKVRPNKAAATALLARVYLFLGSRGDASAWEKAEQEATKIINNSNYHLPDEPNDVFLKNSNETIWNIEPINTPGNDYGNTYEANYLIPTDDNATPKAGLSSQMFAMLDPNDKRRQAWVKEVTIGSTQYGIVYKYKAGATEILQKEYVVVLRLAEQYLIRAEARAHQNNLIGINGAQADLDSVRIRAGLSGTTATNNQEDMLNAILEERHREFFVEGAHRWFDLKRTGKIDQVMSVVTPLKGGQWASYKALFPIWRTEFHLNRAIRGHQNPGYTEPPY